MTFLSLVSCLSVLLVSASAYPSQARDWEEKVFLSTEKGNPQPGTKDVIHHRPYQTRAQGKSSLYYYNNREVLYRLDVVPCNVAEPQPGMQYHYSTIVLFNHWMSPYKYRCYPVFLHQDTIKNDNPEDPDNGIFRICSPGFKSNFNYYPSRRLSMYRIKCDGTVTILDNDNLQQTNLQLQFRLQSKVRVSYNERKCVDYVNITESGKKPLIYCGDNKTFVDQKFNGSVLITFRSSQYNNNYKGFLFRVKCTPKNTSQQVERTDCIRISQYLTKRVHKEDYTNELMSDFTLYIKEKLLYFQHQYVFQGGHAKVMSVSEAYKHRKILRMAVLGERSCDAVMKLIGQEVTKLFPRSVVLEETVRVLADDFSIEE